ncbi:MAG: hypothetical protein ACRCT1_18235 [Microcoleaceae cyanobacterium]
MPFAPTEEIQPAEAGFVCADRGFNRPVKLIRLILLYSIIDN